LGIDGCEMLTSSFNRKNLYYEVRPKGKGKEDVKNIAELINEKHAKQTGIIYCLSRKNCEDLAKALRVEHKIKAHHYHAGIAPEEKSRVQKEWQAGKYTVIVATIAFGMGIDKANVRFVIHHSIPKSLEGYYQETGRAGRDGHKSSCYLFYGYGDAGKIRRMIDDSDGSWEQKDRQHQMLRKMVQFCENQSDCRRVQVLGYFGENFRSHECHALCDNCNSDSTFENVDYTEYAREAIDLVRQIAKDDVTVLYCIDIFRGSESKRVREGKHAEVAGYGVGSDLDRGDIERLFYRLLSEEALMEKSIYNRAGFTNQYVGLGRRCKAFEPGKEKLFMQVRTKTPAKAKNTAKTNGKKTTNAKRAKTDLPLSTFVSSPIVAAKKGSKTVQKNLEQYAYDDFVEPDNDVETDGDYAETDDEYSDDAFEPVRIAGQTRQEKNSRTPGPPITADKALAGCRDDFHRLLVLSFADSAKRKVKDIMISKSLRTAPFSESMLREMAINFTDTPEKMLQIPGVTEEKVKLYGKEFLKMVKDTRETYEAEQIAPEEEDDEQLDPNSRNVIDLVSDDDEDYGDFDLDEDEDDGEPSAYFQPQEVQDFNARFANSQSNALRTAAGTPTQTAKKGKFARKKTYRAKDSMASNGRANVGRRKQYARDEGEGSNRVWKKRGGGKRSTSGGGRSAAGAKRNAGGGTGQNKAGSLISMMPT
jgi:bloom syndrome protein